MADTFRVASSENWFSRLGKSIGGVVVGIVLVPVAIVVLFWNEGRAVHEAKAIAFGRGSVVSIAEPKVDPANEGKLVHLTGQATTDETLTDDEFGISVNALKLRRGVEVYQWSEDKEEKEEKELGGGTKTVTTYTYEKVWSEKPIPSSEFAVPEGHENNVPMKYAETSDTAEKVTVGEFTLNSNLVDKVGNFTLYPLSRDLFDAVPETAKEGLLLNGQELYYGGDPADPQIGDLKIRWTVVAPGPVSVISEQVRDTFRPFKTPTGEIEYLRTGTHTAEAMFDMAQAESNTFTWITRGVGLVLMVVGFSMVLYPLQVLADVIPMVGSIVGAGAFVIALALSGVLSLGTIAVAWVFFRPLLGILLLVAAAALLVGVVMLMRRRKPQPA
jgi:hypothetical protein